MLVAKCFANHDTSLRPSPSKMEKSIEDQKAPTDFTAAVSITPCWMHSSEIPFAPHTLLVTAVTLSPILSIGMHKRRTKIRTVFARNMKTSPPKIFQVARNCSNQRNHDKDKRKQVLPSLQSLHTAVQNPRSRCDRGSGLSLNI